MIKCFVEVIKIGRFVDLTGKKFGRLLVKDKIYHIRPSGQKEIRWYCICDCGNKKDIPTSSLTKGLTQSCGCLHKEVVIETNKSRRKCNKYNLTGEYGIGYTSNTGNVFYFDLEDYNKIKNYCWYEGTYKYIKSNNKENKVIVMHRIIMNCNDEDLVVDHINHNREDNRKKNLRICSYKENSYNQKKSKNNTSGVIGIYYRKHSDAWESYIGYNGDSIFLGYFKDKDDAIKARLKAEVKYYKEFAPQKHLYKKYGIEDCDNIE